MNHPVIHCPLCDAFYEVPVYTDGRAKWYDLDEAQLIADDHIHSHARDLAREIEEFLSASA